MRKLTQLSVNKNSANGTKQIRKNSVHFHKKSEKEKIKFIRSADKKVSIYFILFIIFD